MIAHAQQRGRRARAGRRGTASVRPMMRHPPGDASGYTPACAPPMATLPAGTCLRGADRRGVASSGGRPPRYGKHVAKPTKYTT